MGLFGRTRPKCRKFFTYGANTLDINALSVGLSQSDLPKFNASLGQLKISPEYVKVSERLMQMDLQQYDLCQTIANIRDEEERDRKYIQLADIKMEMMRLAANPQAYENKPKDNGNENDQRKPISNSDAFATDSGKAIMQLLDQPSTIPKALDLADRLPFIGSDRFLFNQKRLKYQSGMTEYERVQWVLEMKNFLAKYGQ